tara:strand:- start:918 stop:2027 length:1110 start_codon:yes stop_codon:yes gene_type:complete
MKKFVLISVLFLVLVSFASFVYAAEISAFEGSEKDVYYFGRVGCPHCAVVVDSGILEKVAEIEGVNFQKYDVSLSQEGRDLFVGFSNDFGISSGDRGVPMTVIDCDQDGVGDSYLMGDTPIINELENDIETCEVNTNNINQNGVIDPNAGKLTLWSVVGAAVIDSINPCAFGVLIFLMLSLLKIGSAKRALKAGLVYTFVVFVVYFLAGFGIFSVIQAFTGITRFIYVFAGVLVLLLGLWQFKDVLFPKVGPSLQISPKAKPLIERMIHKGTIPAMILLGVLVSLFELPCTGGIYLGILTLMSINKTFAVSYLLLYNLIFVLPLIILTLLIYKGTSPERLQNWTVKKRTWMKVAGGIVLVGLGIYILFF